MKTKECACYQPHPNYHTITCNDCKVVQVVRVYSDGRERVMFRCPRFEAIAHVQQTYAKGEKWYEIYR